MYLNFFVTYVLDPTAAAGMGTQRAELRTPAGEVGRRVFVGSICAGWWLFRHLRMRSELRRCLVLKPSKHQSL